MFHDFWDCARAVWRHWIGLLTGGVLMFMLGFLQNTGHKIPPTAYWLVALGTLFFAFFKAWRDEHRAKQEALNKLTLQPNVPSSPALSWDKLYEEKKRLEHELENHLKYLAQFEPQFVKGSVLDDPNSWYQPEIPEVEESEYQKRKRMAVYIRENLEIIKGKMRRSP